jgi:EmrB/QacA subfamily drug resistance transporter
MPEQSQRERRVALLVLCAAAFVAALDLFVVNVAFDAIGDDLGGSDLGELSWVLNAYAVVYAALLVPAGRLADRVGRKPAFLAGLALFTAASAACALAPSLWPLVGARVLQAAGAAVLTPASLGLVLTTATPEGRARAVRVWAAAGAVAAAAGPVVGGLLLTPSWRWVFLVNVPLGIAAAVVGVRTLRDSRDPAVTRMPDLAGAVVLAVAVGALAFAVVEGVPAAYLAAAAGLAVVVRRSARHPLPVVEPALVRVPAFAWVNVTAVAFSAAFAANLLLLCLWLQQGWGWSALATGLAVAPGPAVVPLFAAVADRLRRRVGPGAVVAAGCLTFSTGLVLVLASLTADGSYAGQVLPGLLLGGAGVGLALPEIMSAGTSALPAHRVATGSGMVTMSRQLGAVVGVSVAVALLGAPATLDGFRDAWWAAAATGVLAALTATRMSPRRARVPATPIATEVAR